MFEAVTLLSYKNYRNFNLFHMYLKKTSSTIIHIIFASWCILSFCLIGIMLLLEMLLFQESDFSLFSIFGINVLIICIPLIYILLTLLSLYKIRAAYKQYALVNAAPEHYMFEEEHVTVTMRSTSLSNVCEYQYEMFDHIYETKDCFYLYINKIQAHVIKKESITQGTPEQLSAFLSQKVGYKFNRRLW